LTSSQTENSRSERIDFIKVAAKTKQQLLVEMEELRMRLDSAEQRLQEANELLQSEIMERKRAEETLVQAQKHVEGIVETIREPLLVLTADLKVISANRSFFQTFRVTPEETEGRFFYSIGNHQWDIPALRMLLEEIVPQNTQFNDFEVDHEFPTIGPKMMLLNARRVYREGKGTEMILLAIEDVTERKQLEEELRKSYDELEARIQERTAELAQRNEELTIEIAERLKMEQTLLESKEQLRILAAQILSAQEKERKRIALEVHDVLGSSLSAIKFKAEEALHYLPKDGTLNISKPLEALIPLIQDTIEETRRIQADLRPPLLDDVGVVATLSWYCRRFKTIYSHIGIEQAVTIREEEVPDHLKIVLFRIIQEAMNNIGKHAQADSVYLGLRKLDGAIDLSIKDNGEGFDPESLSYRDILKKGLGLSSMKERIEFSGGSFSIESAKGKGTVIKAHWLV
jgi:PAS domain S-box-containing protein